MERRHFLGTLGAAAVAPSFVTADEAPTKTPEENGSLFRSPCVLQNPKEDSITVAWCVNGPATGWVEWGLAADKLDQKADGAVFGLRPFSENTIIVRVSGLRANTRYFYRAACAKVDFKGSYDITTFEPEYTPVYSFVTPGAAGESGSFSILNDTHQNVEVLKKLTAKIADLNAAYTIWNGDLTNNIESREQIVKYIMAPCQAANAMEKPLLLSRGNHDHRGRLARVLPEYLTPWEQEKFAFRGLGYSYVVRQGDLAILGMDTGEDKPDFRREWAGLASFEPYIAQQGAWLAEVMESESVKTAKFVVLTCHIPLFDDRPIANPGTLETGYSSWKKIAWDAWGPTLQKHGVQLVVAAHVHRHRVDPATSDRCWTQITGGGCSPTQTPTVIHGAIANGKLVVEVHDVFGGTVLARLEWNPR
ncbi:MAG: FN3 domain-containing metallophosphoesterase family protein [Planctomycetia bacterium]|nr:FN3 domain-containing metallophosphoesterase family protein [Planctomycetia bacterium]